MFEQGEGRERDQRTVGSVVAVRENMARGRVSILMCRKAVEGK